METAASIRENRTPPASPLKRMKNPFIRHHATGQVPFRPRRRVRLGILIVTLVIVIAALNELRCMKYGCVSRVWFSGDGETTDQGGNAGEFVGGGSVLPVGWDSSAGNMEEGNGDGMPLQTPNGEETGVEAEDGNGNSKHHDRKGDSGNYDGSVYAVAVDKAYPVGS